MSLDHEKDSLDNVSSVSMIIKTQSKFDALLKILESPVDVLDTDKMGIIFQGVTSATDAEITRLSMHMHGGLKKHGKCPSPANIESKIREHIFPDAQWGSHAIVGQEEGRMYIQKNKKEKIYISNFVIEPDHTIVVQGQDGDKYHSYRVFIMGDNRTYSLRLRAQDFNDLKSLQSEVARQLAGTSAFINGCNNYMLDLQHKFISSAKFEVEKVGTSLIGLERPEDGGPKYFCTPDAILDQEGNKSSDMIYMGNEQTNQEEVRNYTNLKYEKKKWVETAKVFLSHIVYIQDKTAMMSLIGWMGAIPHDYVIRKVCGMNAFPHCHIVGEPGSGKTTLMTLLKQYMGHNDTTPRAFPTPFETSKLLNSSYSVPVVLDEYGKRWRPEQHNAFNKVLVESYNKSPWSRGTSSLGSVYYKYKNPLLFGGQMPTFDQALATRIVPVRLYKSFHNSARGTGAKKALVALQNMVDKNFWVGYNLWASQDDNEDVKTSFDSYRHVASQTITDQRVADIYTVVMLGLKYMKRLADELSIDVGYTEDDILNMPEQLDGAADAIETQDISPLSDFLQELVSYGTSIGNHSAYGNYFGEGLAIMKTTPNTNGPGQYGGTHKYTACIYDRPLLLIKVDEIVKMLNRFNKTVQHNAKEIMVFIQSEFNKSQENPMDDNNLVLAPKQYRTKHGFYTAFNLSRILDEYPSLEGISWKIIR